MTLYQSNQRHQSKKKGKPIISGRKEKRNVKIF
nr:MAG TPA: hypothetical protein [Bacteriophage sp.]